MAFSDEYEVIQAHVNILNQQKEQNTTDIRYLKELKSRASHDPVSFVQKLKDATLVLPKLLPLFRIPDIDLNRLERRDDELFSEVINALTALQEENTSLPPAATAADWHFAHDLDKYVSPIESENRKFKEFIGYSDLDFSVAFPDSTGSTRPPSRMSAGSPARPKPTPAKKMSGNVLTNSATINNSSNSTTISEEAHSERRKRRARTPVVSWTPEEHNRLIDLYEKYNGEEVQKVRYQKIACELGSRSYTQVSSRIHNLMAKNRLCRISGPTTASTFMDFELEESLNGNNFDDRNDSSSDEEHSGAVVTMDKRQRREMTETVHFNIRCDGCSVEPILGFRYRCKQCQEIDLCSKCKDTFTNNSHSTNHQLITIQRSQDAESRSMMGEYAYLDPNFI